jgi:hypothetical protein
VLPPGEAFDRSFFMDIVLDSLKKMVAQIPDPNPQNGYFCIWIMTDSVWPIMKFNQITSTGGFLQFTVQIWPHPISGYLNVNLEGSSFETAEELKTKITDILMLIPTLPFRTVFQEWQSRLLGCTEAGGEHL